jgi:O-antigen ligase
MLGSGLAVLVWSGSKAGWLLAMGLAVLVLFLLGPWSLRAKIVTASIFAVVGLAAFAFVFREKLSRGATSVSARFDYWTAAVQGFRERPLLGHGPGLFKRVYAERKRPESEMAQLTHNDYLQQATDSGLPGFLSYLGFVTGSLIHLYRQRRRWSSPLAFAVWLGLLAWFFQGFVEFGLYIPASAWCAFALLGWLLAQKPSDTSSDSLLSRTSCASSTSTVRT